MAKKARPGKRPREKSAPARAGAAQPRAKAWRWLIAPGAIALAGVAMLVYLAVERDRLQGRANPAAAEWAEAYWQRPIPPQGEPPADFLDPVKSLRPEDCGTCHPAQYAGWKDSLHSIAMGAGVVGQFPGLGAEDVTQCHDCHAPLSEQYARLPGQEGLGENPHYDPALRAQGLTCAACHLRGHRRHGPPLREGKPAVSQAVHGEPFRTPFFQASEFCKGCHQHPEDSMRVNGKPVENTYNEWLASPAAAQGIHCQGCHMPDRQHLWKGIHDPDMTRSGVTIAAEIAPEAPRGGRRLEARLTIANTGTGHAFPSYTTPAVYLRAALLDANGQPLRGHYEETILQRRLDMSAVPWSEEFDTRLLPGRSAQVTLEGTIPAEAASLYLWIWVDPDQFYNRFFRAMLDRGADFAGREQIQAAFDETVRRGYLLWSKKIAIAPGA